MKTKTPRTAKFQDGEVVRIKETGEVVTVRNWFFYANRSRSFTAQYHISEYPGTWYAEDELEKGC